MDGAWWWTRIMDAFWRSRHQILYCSKLQQNVFQAVYSSSCKKLWMGDSPNPTPIQSVPCIDTKDWTSHRVLSQEVASSLNVTWHGLISRHFFLPWPEWIDINIVLWLIDHIAAKPQKAQSYTTSRQFSTVLFIIHIIITLINHVLFCTNFARGKVIDLPCGSCSIKSFSSTLSQTVDKHTKLCFKDNSIITQKILFNIHRAFYCHCVLPSNCINFSFKSIVIKNIILIHLDEE